MNKIEGAFVIGIAIIAGAILGITIGWVISEVVLALAGM